MAPEHPLDERAALFVYRSSFPWERYWINQRRRRRGLRPFSRADLRF